MIYRILFLSLITFACLKDNILAQVDDFGRTVGEELEHLIKISEPFPDLGEEIRDNLTVTVSRGRELLQYMKESVESVKEGNVTALKGISDRLLLFYNQTSPLNKIIQMYGVHGREALDTFKNFSQYIEQGLRNLNY
ncbi:uncharacterized protein [Periplaneta americana]|uniref:uncharacterized protein n=1 Tax=Periplaneta americana TaxID=6978 RepID=UPI0037E93081